MKEKRQELGLSRQDVSEICNMHEGYVKQIETGSKLPALPLLLKICETLHTSPNYLFEFSEDKDVQDVLELLYTLTPEQLKAVKHMISSYLEFKENMEEQNERLKRGYPINGCPLSALHISSQNYGVFVYHLSR